MSERGAKEKKKADLIEGKKKESPHRVGTDRHQRRVQVGLRGGKGKKVELYALTGKEKGKEERGFKAVGDSSPMHFPILQAGGGERRGKCALSRHVQDKEERKRKGKLLHGSKSSTENYLPSFLEGGGGKKKAYLTGKKVFYSLSGGHPKSLAPRAKKGGESQAVLGEKKKMEPLPFCTENLFS